MAQVDFSNAVLTPLLGGNYSPIASAYVSLYSSSEAITNSSGSPITSSLTRKLIKDEHSEFVVSYSGTFSASGTEFYIAYTTSTASLYWRVSNISFVSGDTFVLQINCNLTTN